LFLSDDPLHPLSKSADRSIAHRRILGKYLEQQGFTESEADGTLYLRFDLFLKVGFDSLRPDCRPSIVLEFGERTCDEEGRLAAVPAWQELPDWQRMRRCWTFQTEEEFEMVLLEMRTKLMKAAEKHLWLNQDALEEAIGKDNTIKAAFRVSSDFPAPDGEGCA